MKRADITVLLADDHEVFREGLRVTLRKIKGVKLLADAPNGEILYELVEKFNPDLVITDIKMPVLDGIDLTRKIKTSYPEIKVLALSTYDDDSLIFEMMEAGASGYVVKNIGKEELELAIKTVSLGKTYCCEIALNKLIKEKDKEPAIVVNIKFTKREIEVMKLVSRSLSSKQIANELKIDIRTVESHRASIYKKIGVTGAAAVAIFAAKHGYI